MISDNSNLEYLKKAIEKTVTEEDVLDLIDDGVLNFEKLTREDEIDLNLEIIYRLSNIKSANTLKIDNLNFPKLSIVSSGCSFHKIDIQNSTFYSVTARSSNVIEIRVDYCTIVKNLDIRHNKNLESVNLSSLTTNMVSFQKLKNLKTIQLFANKIENFDLKHITILPEGWFNLDENSIKKLSILNSTMNIDLNLYYLGSSLSRKIILGPNFNGKDLENLTIICEKSTFKSLTINNPITNITINDCEILGKLTIGSTSDINELSKLEIFNNKIDNNFFIGKHIVKDQLKIENNHIDGGFWKLNGFSMDANCKSEIKGQSFDNAIFQNCDFSNFDFQNTDIHLAEIINPTWKELKIARQKRIQFRTENEDTATQKQLEKQLKELKKQYSFFRKKFESENNYIDASKFKISEALIRTDILKTQNLPRWFLLKFSRGLNLFGESIGRPLIWYCLTLVVFAIIYLLTGFNEINYNINLNGFKDSSSLDFPSICEFIEASLFSFKNISPVKLEYDFGFSKSSRPTQIISMFQKLINLIIVGSLIASMRNFFRK